MSESARPANLVVAAVDPWQPASPQAKFLLTSSSANNVRCDSRGNGATFSGQAGIRVKSRVMVTT